MNVREIVISEFRSVFMNNGIRLDERIIRIVEAPFNLQAVQLFVDRDIARAKL
jgi:hypothetical protein